MIGIICAMASELEEVLQYMDIERTEKVGQCQLHYGTIAQKEVVACLAGVGKCNAAMSTTIVCLQAKVDLIINVGVAGGLKADQNVGDVVLSSAIVQADYDTSPIDGAEGKGLYYSIDSMYVEKAIQIAQELHIPYHVGLIATQDIFMARKEDYKKLLKAFPKSICSEMEGGAIVQVAHAFQIPCFVIRTLSDVVAHGNNPVEFSQFAQIASKQAASIILLWCKNQ